MICGVPLQGLTFMSWIFREEEKKCGAENISEDIVAENCPNLAKTPNLQI